MRNIIIRSIFHESQVRRYKMVRYFPNRFEDYKPGVETVDNEKVKGFLKDHLQLVTKRFVPSSEKVDGGLYVGVAGVAYMFYHLSKNPHLSDDKHKFLQKAMEYLKPAMNTSTGDKTSFLLGDAGTYALATVIYKAAGKEEYIETLNKYTSLYKKYLVPTFLDCGGDEFFVGRSGYLAGILWLSRELNMQVLPAEDIYKICDVIVASGRSFAKSIKSKSPLMYHYYNTTYLGAAHGISFILQMLITVPGYLDYNKEAAKDIQTSIEYIASLQNDEGNWPSCMEEEGLDEHILVHWCHGAPGIIYLMAKSYLVYKDAKYLDICLKAGEVVWNKGLLRKGPGICHGVAGSGYVFLLLYRLTGDQMYLYRARVFFEFIYSNEFNDEARVPDNPESLYEGRAGTLCFLSDLILPEKAEFPFQDVFSD